MPSLYMRCSRFFKRYLNTYLNTLHTLKQSYFRVCVCMPLYAHMFLLVDSPKSSVVMYIRLLLYQTNRAFVLPFFGSAASCHFLT